MSRALPTSTGWLAIPFLLALAACAYPPGSPSATLAETPTAVRMATLSATRPVRTSIPQPSATPGIFRSPAFSISEVPGAAASLSLVFDPRYKLPPPEDYLLFLRVTVPRDESGRWGGELYYASLDGLTQARILSFRGQFSLIGAAPARGQLHLADFTEDEIVVSTIDWSQGNARELSLKGEAGLSEDQIGWVVSVDSSSAFSPNGRSLVWDCEPGGQYAWCLLDLEEEAGYTIVPGGEVWDAFLGARQWGNFRWAPNSDWLLAECEDLGNPSQSAECIVFPADRQVRRLDLPGLRQAGIPFYVLPHNGISVDGTAAYHFRESIGAEWQLGVSDLDCGNDRCEEEVLGTLPGQPGESYGWSTSGDRVAFSISSYEPLYTSEVWVVSVTDGEQRRIATNVHGYLLDWIPDSEWLLIECGGIPSKYRLCGLSTEGVFRPIVPDVEGWRTEFLAWWHVP